MDANYLHNPEEMPTRFATAWNNRDAEALAAVFAPDADFVNVVGLWWHDRKSIRKAHDYGLRVIFGNSHLKTGRIKVRRLSADHAVVHARMHLSGQTPLGPHSHPGIRQNIFTFVMEKTQAGWHCVAAHNTDIVPGKETNLTDDTGTLHSVDYRSSPRP